MKKVAAGGWLLRLLKQIARQAEADVRAIPDWPDTAIHRLRKRMKKLRSLIQLAFPVMEEAEREAWQERIREIKNAVSTQRDADVMAALEKDLGAGPAPATRRPKRPDTRKLAALVKGLADSVARLGSSGLSWDDVAQQFEKIGRRTRKAWKHARQDANEETLHDWRKLVKRHYHQSLALHRWLGAKRDRRLLGMRRLGSLLGRCHDLDVFTTAAGAKRTTAARKKVLRKAGRRRKELTARTFRRAAKLYGKPGPELRTPE